MARKCTRVGEYVGDELKREEPEGLSAMSGSNIQPPSLSGGEGKTSKVQKTFT